VNDAKKGADVVFRGTIIDLSGGKVFFQVDRVWKGNIGRTLDMPEGVGCLVFSPALLKVGNDHLIYATWIPRGAKDGAYFTNICTRTNLSTAAGEDFSRLGQGRSPRNSP
jgi:hypothetical protein